MSFEPINDEEGNPIDPKSLLQIAAVELVAERKRSATNLIKNFLMKQEGLIDEIKRAELQLKGKKDSLEKVKAKIERLKSGDWSVLEENKSASKPDSEQHS